MRNVKYSNSQLVTKIDDTRLSLVSTATLREISAESKSDERKSLFLNLHYSNRM